MNELVAVDESLGPAMEALRPLQREFVRRFIALGQNGWQDNSLAAGEAGYKGTPEVLRVTGHRLAHNPAVQAAIFEETRKRVSLSAAVVATPIAISIAMDEKVPARDRLRACEMLFNRGGMPAMSEHKVTVEHKQPVAMIELAARLAKELGVDPARLIGANRAAAAVLEGEFREVGPDEQAAE